MIDFIAKKNSYLFLPEICDLTLIYIIYDKYIFFFYFTYFNILLFLLISIFGIYILLTRKIHLFFIKFNNNFKILIYEGINICQFFIFDFKKIFK